MFCSTQVNATHAVARGGRFASGEGVIAHAFLLHVAHVTGKMLQHGHLNFAQASERLVQFLLLIGAEILQQIFEFQTQHRNAYIQPRERHFSLKRLQILKSLMESQKILIASHLRRTK